MYKDPNEQAEHVPYAFADMIKVSCILDCFRNYLSVCTLFILSPPPPLSFWQLPFLASSPRHSEVIVHLRNRGHDAYRHEVFGDTIVVERHIRSDGTGTYKLKSGSSSGSRGKGEGSSGNRGKGEWSGGSSGSRGKEEGLEGHQGAGLRGKVWRVIREQG